MLELTAGVPLPEEVWTWPLMVPPSLPSAGIGRTGTIIVIDMLMENISTKGEGYLGGTQEWGWVGSLWVSISAWV